MLQQVGTLVARRTTGLLAGAAGALVQLVFVAVLVLAMLPVIRWRRRRAALLRAAWPGTRALAEWDRRRLARWFAVSAAEPVEQRRVVTFLALRSMSGLLAGAILGLVCWGLVTVFVMLRSWLLDVPADYTEGADQVTTGTVLVAVLPGAVLLYLALQGLAGVVGLERRLAHHYLGRSRNELLQRRISELAESRAGVVDVVDAERRRIERDLHDGVQQRLVALGVLLGRARRGADAERRDELLRAAHEETQAVLDDLRQVAWRVYPSALDTLGLEEALAVLAARPGVPVEVECHDCGSLPEPIATAVYFVVSETVNNAVKHAAATRVDVAVRRENGSVLARVSDDGVGGADPDGGGLSGLRRRVAGQDGTFGLVSPAGGPTVVEVTLPCG
ncbi:signal transduction histidine kinase [Haloactinopolyspora alba]|uniref:histidine kinase n=1 Tax=Haloactinopolyspora alba TaxID=648780 RepID=A0A2P8E278_9ACTN|nr:histidine kinase [Haloactinopolyspora alba]PSL03576.1 signal transduction histidine kinase [Haloactinopolyspora alba]